MTNVDSGSVGLVSAIIATRDRPDYLKRALRSLRNQTYARIEIVVVDDGSSMDLVEITRAYSVEKFVKVNYHCEAAAFNEGFLRSEGEFVIFCDDDTEHNPTMIERLRNTLLANPTKAYAYCGIEWTHDDDSRHVAGTTAFNAEELLVMNYISGNSLIRRSKFAEAGMFDTSFRSLEDWDLWLRMLEMGEEGVCVPEVLISHLKNEGPRTSSDKHPWPDGMRLERAYEMIALRHPQVKITSLRQQLAVIKEQRDALMSELNSAKVELEVIRGSFGFRVMRFYTRIIHQVLPDGTKRGELRKLLTKKLTDRQMQPE